MKLATEVKLWATHEERCIRSGIDRYLKRSKHGPLKKVAEVLFRAHELRKYIVYIDETSFTRELGNKFGYAPKGANVTFPFKKPQMSIGGSCAISRGRLRWSKVERRN